MTAVPGRTPDDLELAGVCDSHFFQFSSLFDLFQLLCGFAGVYMHSNGTSVPPSTRSPSAPIFEQSSSSTSVSSGDHVASGSSYQGETPRGTRSKSPVKVGILTKSNYEPLLIMATQLEEDDRTIPGSSNGSASQIPAFSRATSPSVAMATAEGSASSSNRKRKIREDDPSEHSDHGRPSAIEHANVSTRLPSGVRTPRKASRPVSGVKSSPGTPSLKIRLPALNHLNNTGSSSSRNAALPTTLTLNSGSISTG
ncbi:hypothetical protein DL96DRAFT_1069274 [Flagelloscypha sp. PMI_526]|nr:hypothetical protein DL96DRAFT_1069274 [Flagelloscypha sp. PMI_526]